FLFYMILIYSNRLQILQYLTVYIHKSHCLNTANSCFGTIQMGLFNFFTRTLKVTPLFIFSKLNVKGLMRVLGLQRRFVFLKGNRVEEVGFLMKIKFIKTRFSNLFSFGRKLKK